ncbi:hypothetical protein [Candidatus Competibacter phosphatis]|uniref:hypothetical protein n=1 Tax=Candidatus Competibacter phosphatis TaxID=221280 RepID=UPI0028AC8971|nr:hypothetical protein [Candidatus Competibacter phosphatis]
MVAGPGRDQAARRSDLVHLPIYWGWEQYLLAVGFALVSAVGAAYLPARKAGRVQPVAILRGLA